MIPSIAIIARVLLYVGSLIAIGECAAQWVRGTPWRARPAPGENGHALAAWLAVSFALLLLFVAQFLALDLAPSTDDVAMLARQTTWGRSWLVLAGCGVAGTVAAAARASLAIRFSIAGVLAMAMGGLGHAAADEAAPLLSRALDAVHVAGAGVWLGALLCLGRDVTANAWSRFSGLAFIVAPLTVLSGAGSAWRRLGDSTVSQAAISDYGQLLAAKVVIVMLVLALGARHRRHLQAQRTPAASMVRLELVLALAVLSVTAVLTGTAPPGE